MTNDHIIIAVSLFVDDILVELTNTVSDGKIQITILILRRCAFSNNTSPVFMEHG